MYLRHIRLACLTLLLVSAARAGAANVDHPSIRPGERFEGPLFNVVAPKSEGWVGLSRNSSGMAFARHGATEPDSDVAALTVFQIPADSSPEEFLSQITVGTAKEVPAPRFEVIRSRIELSQARPYTCVKYEATSIDHGKSTLFSKKQPLQLQVVALYCRHPQRPDLGFAVSYSHRGKALSTAIEVEAESFIDSIEVVSPQEQPNKSYMDSSRK